MNILCPGCGRTVGAPVKKEGKNWVVTSGWAVMCRFCSTGVLPGTVVQLAPKKKKH